jgi:DNA modification methylase
MKPYYEQDGIVIHLGDALEVMASLPEQSIDSLVADPPYCAGAISEAQRTRASGQGLRSETTRRLGWFVGDNMGTSGLTWLLRSVAVEARRVVKTTGSMIVFCDWRMISAIQPAIESAGLRYQNLIAWDKEHMGLGSGFRCQHEMILHFTFGEPEYHHKGTANVLRCRRVDRDDREHQTQKPTDLMEKLIRVVCPPGGTIIDPFGGSGSTAIAARDSGRKCILIEHDPEHCETTANRIKQSILFGVA